MSDPTQSTSNVITTDIAVHNLSKTFGTRKALDGVSFEVPRGAFLSVFGPNGAGKTTLLRILATLSRPSRGTLTMLETDALQKPEDLRGSIGFISHQPLVYGDLSALENLVFYGRLYGADDVENKAKELLALVELDHRANDAARTFSRGMMQRLSLARALINDPQIILLDEPYSGLDPHATFVLDSLISRIREGKTFVMVSHDLERGHALCTHALLLDRGKVVAFDLAENIGIEDLRKAYDPAMLGGVLS